MRSSRPTIRLRGIRKAYRTPSANGGYALDGIDFDLPPGDYVSLMGPSGSGKTTLLNLLGLLDVPTEGSVYWDDDDVGRWSERQRSRLRLNSIGFIFQRFYLLPMLTAQENVELPMRARGVGRGERAARARELLERVGLAGKAAAYPHQLSGGEEQRVAIARALANAPTLLLADEPTGELDSANSARVLDLLESARADVDATLVLVTHNPEVAQRARRSIQMRDGRIVANARGG